jgi:hypothetical protein
VRGAELLADIFDHAEGKRLLQFFRIFSDPVPRLRLPSAR